MALALAFDIETQVRRQDCSVVFCLRSLVFVSGFDESRSALSGVVLLSFLSLILRLAGLLSISFILPAVLYATTIFILIDRLSNSE